MVWEDVEFDAEKIPNIKLGIHVGQIVFSIVVWVLEIVVFRGTGATINGQNGWTFAVCFLSVPAWIYLCMAPRFPRTRKLAEPHVMVVVDCLFTILWLSAFATQASYNSAGLCGSACPSSMAIVGMGFFVFLFFGITAFLSIYSLKYYQFHGHLPGYDRIGVGKDSHDIDPDKAAFSTTPYGGGGVMGGGNDEEAYHPINHGDNDHDQDPMDPRHDNIGNSASAYGGASSYGGASHTGSMGYNDGNGRQSSPYGQDDPYAARPSQHDNPFSQGSHQNNPFEDHHGYTPPSHSPAPPAGGAQHGAVLSNQGMYIPPSAQEDYDDGRPAQFPAGNYDRAT